jgi:hypothetical protein
LANLADEKTPCFCELAKVAKSAVSATSFLLAFSSNASGDSVACRRFAQGRRRAQKGGRVAERQRIRCRAERENGAGVTG